MTISIGNHVVPRPMNGKILERKWKLIKHNSKETKQTEKQIKGHENRFYNIEKSRSTAKHFTETMDEYMRRERENEWICQGKQKKELDSSESQSILKNLNEYQWEYIWSEEIPKTPSIWQVRHQNSDYLNKSLTNALF